MMLNASDCLRQIESNPDISGIGVRSAIYSQALLSILYSLYCALDGVITSKELKTMSQFSVNIILTACALLVSTIIQTSQGGIYIYHVLIVLQLSWINSFTLITVHMLKIYFELLQGHSTWSKMVIKLFTYDGLVSSVHFMMFGSVGVWAWNYNETFGSNPTCNQNTINVFFSIPVSLSGMLFILRLL